MSSIANCKGGIDPTFGQGSCSKCETGYVKKKVPYGVDECYQAYTCNNGTPRDHPLNIPGKRLPGDAATPVPEEKCERCNQGYNLVSGVCMRDTPTISSSTGTTIPSQFIVTAEQQRQDIIIWVSLFFVMLLIGFFIMKKMGVTSKKTGLFSWVGSDIKVNDLPVAFWVFIWTLLASVPIWWFGIDHCVQWGEDGRKILNYRSSDPQAPEICNRMRAKGVAIPDSFFGSRKSNPNESCDRPDGQCWNFHWRHFFGFAISIIVCYIIFTALIVGAMPSGKFPDGIPIVLIISILAFTIETGWKRAKWRGKHTVDGKKADKENWRGDLTTEDQKPMVAQWQPIMIMGMIGFVIFGLFVFGGIGNKSLNDIDNEEKVMFGIVAAAWLIHWGYDLSQTYSIPHHA